MNNSTIIQFFDWYCSPDGKHWNHFAEQVQRLNELGISAVWLPPAYKGTKGIHSEGYDVYDIYDLGEFDQKGSVRTRYGTKEEFINAVKKAREAGIKIYADIVFNHMGGGDETERVKVRRVDHEDRNQFVSDEFEIDAFTKFRFPGRNGKYSNFEWNYSCFTGVDYAADTQESAIFFIQNEYGESWEPIPHNEKGNFDYLMFNDIEMRNPSVREELRRWIKWYYETVPFDGLRLDAIKHINPSFFIEWLDYVRAEINPEVFVVGEFWLSDDLNVLLNYINITEGRLSLFDAPLHHNFSQASLQGDQYDLRKIFDFTLVKERPELAVTFVDNHDTQPLQALEEYTEFWFKPLAYALILLREQGYPCVFYPDIYGSCYSGVNRNSEEVSIQLAPVEPLPALLALRRDKAYGPQLDYFEHSNSIGWVRQGDDEHEGSGIAVVINNSATDRLTIRMEIGSRFSGKQMHDALGYCQDTITIGEDGWGEFFANTGSVSVWVL